MYTKIILCETLDNINSQHNDAVKGMI